MGSHKRKKSLEPWGIRSRYLWISGPENNHFAMTHLCKLRTFKKKILLLPDLQIW